MKHSILTFIFIFLINCFAFSKDSEIVLSLDTTKLLMTNLNFNSVRVLDKRTKPFEKKEKQYI